MKTKSNSIVEVHMLGNFEIIHNGKVLNIYKDRSKRVWILLGYLLVNRHKVIPVGEMIEALWGNIEVNAPEGALRNLIYRLRKILKDTLESSEEYILYTGGTYRWNNKISCEIDIEKFEQMYKEVKRGIEDEECEIDRLKSIILLYKGELLNYSCDAYWLTSLGGYYQKIYMNCIYRITDLLLRRGLYQEVEQVCRHAMVIEPLDEKLHEILIRELIEIGELNKALKHYEYIKELLRKNLGVQPSHIIKGLYMEILESLNCVESSFEEIIKDLEVETNKSQVGPMWCEYGVFRLFYQMLVRDLERTGDSAYIVLITVRGRREENIATPMLEKTLEDIGVATKKLLRKNDIITRFSKTQLILVLQHIPSRYVQAVISRVFNQVSYPQYAIEIDTEIHGVGKKETPCLTLAQ